jgi:hypothetical protein
LTCRSTAGVLKAMERNPYSPPAAQLEMPLHGPASVNGYGFLCFLRLIVVLVVLVLLNILTGVRAPQGTIIVGLFPSIQFSNWRFVQTYRRIFLPIELKRFAFACFFGFWVCDELPVLIRAFLTHEGISFKKVVTAIVATGVDFAIVAAIVYVTVPWAARRFLRRAVA